MKFISFENQTNGKRTLIRADLITRFDVKKHDNPESNRWILYVHEESGNMPEIYEVADFDYDRFVSFLKELEEFIEIFKIDVMK